MNYKDKGALKVAQKASLFTGRIIVEFIYISVRDSITIIVIDIIGSECKRCIIIPADFGDIVNPEYPKWAISGRETPVTSILDKRQWIV